MEQGTNSQRSSAPSYEVFLSFRGADTRYEFTDCLYHDMIEAGINVFRDNESLHVGKEIGSELLQAIENSKIYIPIFSKNYASSCWCLRELAYMVKCTLNSNGNKQILPIFLNVEPADVKLKTNLYKQSLSKHWKTSCTEVESWENALIEVGKIKGWNWKKDEGQGDLIRSVISEVLMKLKVAYEDVPEHLVGVDDRVEAIIKMLDLGYDDVRFLKIHGMAGVGKTTLAKVIFNKLSSSFERCCFLADVRESCKSTDGLLNLLRQLLSKLSGSHFIHKIDHVNDAIKKIESGVLGRKKVLIILDDVDKKEQLKSLARKGNWFGSGSRIIITTTDSSVLTEDQDRNVSTYEVREMKFDDALKLFSRHAFREDYPPNHRVSLSKKIVGTLGKLPLAIEITGSSLIGKSEELWIDTWEKLKEAPPTEVQRKLMVSYQRLDEKEKEIFLDIACFFINEDKIYPFYMWDDCKYYPNIAIHVLVLMSLIKIKDNNTFWMHDQVRDMGRQIVRQENLKHPSERSRVWNHEEALNILKLKEESRNMEALSIRPNYRFSRQVILTHDEFANLRNLRFFRGERVSLVGDFKNLLSNLRWLSWHCKYSKFETTNLHLTNLVVLDLSHSSVSEQWIGWDQIREARKLKVLDLSYCKNLKRTPNLSMWVYLERLVLEGCCNLIEIDPSIGRLRFLTTLDLKCCSSLEKLPEEIGCLQVLTKIVVPKSLLELPKTIGDLHSLLTLDLSNGLISELPYSIGGLVKITRLDISYCKKIKELPNSVGQLQSLVELDLSSTSIGHLPDSIGNLKQLKVLRMSYIEEITKLPSAVGLVEKLEKLEAQGCCNLTGEIPKEIGRLSCLKILNLSHTPISKLPTTVSGLSNLQKMILEDCPELKQLSELPPSLTYLRGGRNYWYFSAKDGELPPSLTYLRRGRNYWYFSAKDEGYEQEEYEEYEQEHEQEEYEEYEQEHEQEEYEEEEYELKQNCDPKDLEQEIGCRSIEEYAIAICLPTRIGALSQQETLVTTLPISIGNFSQLKTLKLSCKNVQFLPQLPSSLKKLQLRDLATTRSPDFSNLKNLSILTFYRCLLEFSSIFDAESEELRMELCELRQLDTPLQPEMKRLRLLEIDQCLFLPEVLDMSRMKNLHKVRLQVCVSLVEIRGLEELGSLCSLSVVDCPSVERMSDLSKVKMLSELIVMDCRKLKSMQGLNHLESLKNRIICRNGDFRVDIFKRYRRHSLCRYIQESCERL